MNDKLQNLTKITVVAIVAILLIASCGSNKENPELEALKAKRDSLKAAQSELNEQIAEVETQIAELDTTLTKRKVLVTTQSISPEPFAHYFQVHGVVESDKNASVTAEMGGTVRSIPVSEGQEVKAGQTLIVLDTDVMRKNVQEIETSLELATTMFEKQKKLWDQKIGSEIQYLQAKNQKESLEAKLASVKSQMGKSIITAPFNGVVDEIFLKVGELAMPQFPAVRLLNLSNAHITADVSEEYITSVKKGDTALVRFGALGEEWIMAEISQLGDFINPNNRTFKAKIQLKGEEEKAMLKPNLLTSIKIKDYDNDSAMVVPINIVQQDAKGNDYLYVVNNETPEPTAKKVMVKTGKSEDGKVEIMSGLSANETIIIQGARSVNDGELIEIKGQ